jgi:hypothetical protein
MRRPGHKPGRCLVRPMPPDVHLGGGSLFNLMLVNLTPHDITIVSDSHSKSVPRDGTVARVSVTRELVAFVDGVPVYRSVYGPVVGLPGPAEGVAFVVSALVRLAVPHRKDVFSPGELVRGADGQPVGCRGLEGNL